MMGKFNPLYGYSFVSIASIELVDKIEAWNSVIKTSCQTAVAVLTVVYIARKIYKEWQK